MSKKSIELLRAEVEKKLNKAGYPVQEWRKQAEAWHEVHPKPTIPTRQVEPPYFKQPMVRPGYSEYKTHGATGASVPRCLAKAAHGSQCGCFALKNSYYCQRHNGRRNGRLTTGEIHHFYTGANESREARRNRSKASKDRKALVKISQQF